MAGRHRVKELAAGIVLIALMSSSYVCIYELGLKKRAINLTKLYSDRPKAYEKA